MPANSANRYTYLWQGRYRSLGWLYNAVTDAGRDPWKEMPWAIDNGVFGAWQNGRAWNHRAFYVGLDVLMAKARSHRHLPMWITVPDWVADRDTTLRRWDAHAPRIASYGAPLAFVVQDGMTPADVPAESDVVFVGGSTDWKERTLSIWCATFPRVHVGRVNGYRMLRACADAGAESCDGTGWFRGDMKQLEGLERFLMEQAGEINKPIGLFDELRDAA